MGNSSSESIEAITEVFTRYSLVDLSSSFQQLAMEGNILLLSKYLETDKDLVHLKDNSMRTLLHWASQCGQVETCSFLLDRGCHIDDQDNFNRTALHYACEKNFTELIKLLCDRGADPNLSESMHEYTPLIFCIINGNLDAVLTLLDVGADVNYTDSAGFSPLFRACECNRQLIILLLINRGAVFDKRVTGVHLIKDITFRNEIMRILGIQLPAPSISSSSRLTSMSQVGPKSQVMRSPNPSTRLSIKRIDPNSSEKGSIESTSNPLSA
jgi:ankyrin repeat protein